MYPFTEFEDALVEIDPRIANRARHLERGPEIGTGEVGGLAVGVLRVHCAADGRIQPRRAIPARDVEWMAEQPSHFVEPARKAAQVRQDFESWDVVDAPGSGGVGVDEACEREIARQAFWKRGPRHSGIL